MESENISQLQLLRENLENVATQKQHIEAELTEMNSALSQLADTDESYRILGKIMVRVSGEELQKELKEHEELAQVRLKNFSSQEEKIKEQMQTIQQKLMKEIKDGKNGQ